MTERFNAFVLRANGLFQSKELPLRLRNFANVFTFDYLSTSLYNSCYVQYLFAEGVFLGNYSTGKFNLNAAATDADLDDLLERSTQKLAKIGYQPPDPEEMRAKAAASASGATALGDSSCTLEQIAGMARSGLTDEQIRAACIG